ncbi:MAG: uroporphyrinogen decarboxylase [Pirellulaceae bacterium]|nr:uroporphyrinogen decarboxylase [Planctomycetales bacterium]
MNESLPNFEGRNFEGRCVAAFESRRGEELARMIQRCGGVAAVAASMREVPLEKNVAAVDFAKSVMTGGIDVMLIMTGVGFKHLLGAIERHVDQRRFLDSLSDIITIARGPKPVAVMREYGLSPTFRVAEPNTWRELLALIDAEIPIANQNVGLQEYGKPNASLVAGLEARGARVVPLRVYRWELPEDLGPLQENIKRIADGHCQLVLFTSAHQVTNMLRCADEMRCERALRAAMRRCVICSIGPMTSEALYDAGFHVDMEPSHPKMGHLVQEAAAASQRLWRNKQQIVATMQTPAEDFTDPNSGPKAPWYDGPFMKACRGEPSDVTPVWLMRQAGRYLPEYREIRARTSFLELCKNPELCAEVMVSTVRRLGVDAAIIFSDLLPILEPMGLQLEYAAGEGPVIHNPVREPYDVDRVSALDSMEQLQFVAETVRQTRLDLSDDIPVIGFAGSPFTLASYVIEGGSSRHYQHTKSLMYRDAGAWKALMEKLAASITLYLNAQIAAGAQCVQLFDSWAGCLGVEDYRQFVLPYVRSIIAHITPGVPVINFATGNPALLPALAEGGSAVVGVDWRIRLDDAWRTVGYDKAVQGNLDPVTLMGPRAYVCQRAEEVLRMANGRPGHIFNLGHGVLPHTPVDNVLALIDTVHNFRHEAG